MIRALPPPVIEANPRRRADGFRPSRREFLALAAMGLAHSLAEAAPHGLKVGEAFPDLADDAWELEGRLPETLRGRVVLVDIWASWCSACKQTFPLMEELHRRFNKQGLIILAVNVDKSRGAMTEFLKENPVTFSVVRDAKRKFATAVNPAELPMSYLLDRAGRIHAIRSGANIVASRKTYLREIEQLVIPSPPKTP